jgi:hypothetical protein
MTTTITTNEIIFEFINNICFYGLKQYLYCIGQDLSEDKDE